MIIDIIVIFTLWSVNLELNPTITNVWLRPDINGELKFCPFNLVLLLIKPFQELWMWKPIFWDINFYTFFIIVYFSYNYIIEFWEIHQCLDQN
jgi:hypothetical protein